MHPAARPSSFSGIGAYITCSHIAICLAAFTIPVIAYAPQTAPGAAAFGIAASTLTAVLGSAALFTETHPDNGFAQWWRREPVLTVWSILILTAAVAVLLLPPEPGASAVPPAALPLALALRAIAAGSFWISSLRIAGAIIACVIASRIVPEVIDLATWDVTPAIAIGAGLALAVLGQDWVYRLALEVDDLRTTEAERAITHERQRFAGDLHDIQGQHLQLLAVEAQLVQRLIDTERYDQARQHAETLGQIAATAVDEMRSVVHAYRPVTVADEAANAVRVLESAGITVEAHVEVPQGLAEATERLLGLTIREGLTNILRHTRARDCALTVTSHNRGDVEGVTVVLADSGPRALQSSSPGTGLASLHSRYDEAAGELTFTSTETAGAQLAGWLPTCPGKVGAP